MRRWFVSAALVLSMAACTFADAPKAAPAKPAARPRAQAPATRPAPLDPRLKSPEKFSLQDGDTVVFLGDSITHQCLYTQYLEDFFYTRMPHAHIRFHNAGVGGDRASDALARFDMDVAAYKPKYVTILLGMNDGGYKQWDQATFATYEKDMLTLLDKIHEIGATAIVMGPTMYDRYAMLIKPNPKRAFGDETSKYYNAVLAFFGTYMRDQASERGLVYVDMFAPLNKLTLDQRLVDPNFSMIPDSVHPDANGHVVMATALLDAEHIPNQVASTSAHLGAEGWKVNVTNGGKASDVTGDAQHLTFTAEEPCLPWILPADAALGYKISIAGHHHSGEPFQVQGLAPGKYELKIDGESVGVFPSNVLSVKIELQNFATCPQYEQALKLAELNKEKNDKAVRPLRNLYLGLKAKRRDTKTTPEMLEAFIAGMKPKAEAFDKQIADYDQKIYELSQPRARKYELLKVSDK